MRGDEAAFWTTLRKNKFFPGDVMRVENVTCPGTPDINGCFVGFEYWAELKVKAASYSALFDVNTLLRQAQRIWFFNRFRTGTTLNLFTLVKFKKDKEVGLFTPTGEIQLNGLKWKLIVLAKTPVAWGNLRETFKQELC